MLKGTAQICSLSSRNALKTACSNLLYEEFSVNSFSADVDKSRHEGPSAEVD